MLNNKFSDDNFSDLQRKEEYERRKNIDFTKGLGNVFYKIVIYSLILVATYMLIALNLTYFFAMTKETAIPLAFILALFIFKFKYIKAHPIKSFLTICFIIAIEYVALDDVQI